VSSVPLWRRFSEPAERQHRWKIMRKPEVTFAVSAGAAAQFPRDGLPEVAFLGRSNVGKSSLLNALAGTRNLAHVSSTPGRTRTVNFFRVGHELYLADLPGYGYAQVSHDVRAGWERLVTSYLVGRAPLALCVFLVDARHQPAEGDRTLQAFLREEGLPYVVAATKSDKLGRGALAQRLRLLERELAPGAEALVAVSAETKQGVPELWRVVREAAQRLRDEMRDRRPAPRPARVG
jgi:GTP-binding protein